MTHLFYFIGIIFLVYKVIFLLSLREKIEDLKLFKKLTKENKGLEWDDYSPEYKKQLKSKYFLFIFIIWFFVGLLSSQWFLFLIFLILNFFVFAPISKIVGFSPLRYITSGANTIIGIIFCLFLIINKYHLHLDTFQIFKDWLSQYGI